VEDCCTPANAVKQPMAAAVVVRLRIREVVVIDVERCFFVAAT
jgi:hypothetical protein